MTCEACSNIAQTSEYTLHRATPFLPPFSAMVSLRMPAVPSTRSAMQPVWFGRQVTRRPKNARERSGVAHGYAYAEAATEPALLNSDGDDYYTILGVVRSCKTFESLLLRPPLKAAEDQFPYIVYWPQKSSANDREIKKAYHAVMRECHPDVAGEHIGSTFATVLNDIYEVRMQLLLQACKVAGHQR